jgi:hypothetical protein
MRLLCSTDTQNGGDSEKISWRRRLSQYDLVALPRRLPHLLGPRHGGAERRGVSRLGGHHPDRHLGRGVQIVQLLQKSTFALARPEIGACRRRFRALATYGSFTAAARTWGRCSTVLRKSRVQRLASLPTTLHWSFLSGKASRMCWRRSRSDTYRLSLLLEQSARAASLVVPQWCAITVAQLPVAAHVQLVRDVQERHRVLRVPPFSGGVRVVDSEHWGEIRRRQPLVHAEPHRGGDHDIAVPFFLRVRVLVADEPGRRTRYPDVRRTQSLGELQSGVAANVASFWHRRSANSPQIQAGQEDGRIDRQAQEFVADAVRSFLAIYRVNCLVCETERPQHQKYPTDCSQHCSPITDDSWDQVLTGNFA